MNREAMIWLAAGILLANAAFAVTPEQKCQGGKNVLTGKFAGCRAKAESRLARSGDVVAYGEALQKCQGKYASGWTKLEDRAVSAGGSCIDIVPEADLRGFVAACTDVVADVAAGGPLPVDVLTCNEDLTTCTTDLGTAQADLSVCDMQRTICEDELDAAELCGNGAIDAGEDCDFGTLNGATCVTEGFAGGALSCTLGCAYDSSGCYNVRFTDNADGTITDNDTGLMWEKKVKLDFGSDGANLQDADNRYGWSGTCSIGGAYCQPDAASEAACLAGTEGNTYGCSQCMSGVCNVPFGLGITAWQWLGNLNTANFGGHNDWRLPTRGELTGIVDLADVTPPGVDVAFHAAGCGIMCTDVTSAACACTQSDYYWSASTYAPYTDFAWTVYFSAGYVNVSYKTDTYYLRAVRGGD